MLHTHVMYRDHERGAGIGAGVTSAGGSRHATGHSDDAQTSTNQDQTPAQKIIGHQGAGSQDRAAESAASAPGRCSVASPAAASAPSLVPPR
jgi:hypothetical protein